MGLYYNIQTACKNAGRSVLGIEKDLGFGRGSIAKWDYHIPSVEKVQDVAKLLNTTVDVLMQGVTWERS